MCIVRFHNNEASSITEDLVRSTSSVLFLDPFFVLVYDEERIDVGAFAQSVGRLMWLSAVQFCGPLNNECSLSRLCLRDWSGLLFKARAGSSAYVCVCIKSYSICV